MGFSKMMELLQQKNKGKIAFHKNLNILSLVDFKVQNYHQNYKCQFSLSPPLSSSFTFFEEYPVREGLFTGLIGLMTKFDREKE